MALRALMGTGHWLDSVLESFSSLWDSMVAAVCYTHVPFSGLAVAPRDSGYVTNVTLSVISHGFMLMGFVGCGYSQVLELGFSGKHLLLILFQSGVERSAASLGDPVSLK